MPRPDTIQHIGLEKYLNQTADEHNGKDFSAFRQYINLGLSDNKIGAAFGVHRHTIRSWREIYEGKK